MPVVFDLDHLFVHLTTKFDVFVKLLLRSLRYHTLCAIQIYDLLSYSYNEVYSVRISAHTVGNWRRLVTRCENYHTRTVPVKG